MSYTPTEWTSGDIISSEKLNKLEAGVEQAIELPDTTGASDGDVLTLDNGEPTWAAPSGGGGGVLVVTMDATTATLDKTWQEIMDADFPVIEMDLMGSRAFVPIYTIFADNGAYKVSFINYGSDPWSISILTTDSADGYPSMGG